MLARIPRNTSPSTRAPQSLEALEARRLRAVDLAVTSVEIVDGLHANTSDATVANITVTNLGNQAILPGEIDLRLRFSEDAVFGNEDDQILGWKTYDHALGAGESWTYTMTKRASAQSSGSFRLIAFVDGFELITETNEGNNIMMSDPGTVVYSDGALDSTDVLGTAGNDLIELTADDTHAFVTVNGDTKHIPLASITNHLFVDAGEGNDVVIAAPHFPKKLAITGSTGHDRIFGGAAGDELSGGAGMDRVFGGEGHDFLLGGAHNDRLYGDGGDDLCIGGGSNDMIFGGAGTNWLIGGNGNDRLFAKGNGPGVDSVSGNAGADVAEAEPTDIVAGVETMV